MKKNTVGECYTTVRTSHVICDDKRNKAFDNAAIIVPDYYSCGESEYNKFLSIAYEEYTGSVLKHSWLSKMDKSIRVDSIKYNDNKEFLKEWPEFEEGFKHLGTITCERMYKNKKGQWVIPGLTMHYVDKKLYSHENVVYKFIYGQNNEYIAKYGITTRGFNSRLSGYNSLMDSNTEFHFRNFIQGIGKVTVEILVMPEPKIHIRGGKPDVEDPIQARRIERWFGQFCDEDNKPIGMYQTK